MIKVNLLVTVPGAAPPRDWFPREQRPALIGLGMLVATALAVLGWWYYLGTVRAAVDARIANAEAQLVKLKEAARLVDKTSARKTELSERLAVIERLRTSKREPVTLLEVLSQSLPEGSWLLEVKQTGSSVQVDGRALSITAVTDFTEHLQNSGLFQRPVEILTTSTETVEDADVVRFSVRAEFVAPPASSLLDAAPGRAGGAPAGSAAAGTAPRAAGA